MSDRKQITVIKYLDLHNYYQVSMTCKQTQLLTQINNVGFPKLMMSQLTTGFSVTNSSRSFHRSLRFEYKHHTINAFAHRRSFTTSHGADIVSETDRSARQRPGAVKYFIQQRAPSLDAEPKLNCSVI